MKGSRTNTTGRAVLVGALALAACARRASSGREVALSTAEGQSFELKRLTGQVVLLDFWATWCEPCKRTLPATQRIADRLGPRGLVAYAVNVERKSSDVKLFLEELKVALPVLRDPDGQQAEAMGGASLPFAVLIDRAGAIRFRHEGAPDGLESKLASEAEQLLAEPAPRSP